MQRANELRPSLNRCQARKVQLERQLTELVDMADSPDPEQARYVKQLQSDLDSVKIEISALERRLDDLMD